MTFTARQRIEGEAKGFNEGALKQRCRSQKEPPERTHGEFGENDPAYFC